MEAILTTGRASMSLESTPSRSAAPAGARGPQDEPALVGRARRGDRGAFGALYERYASSVHGVLLSLVRPDEAQDLVQEVFLRALGSLAHLAEAERFGPWLLTIARNRGRDALRARRPRGWDPEVAGGEPEDVVAPGRPSGAAAEDAEEAARALTAIRRLPEAYRETLVLRLVEGMSGPEIAARTGRSHGAVRVNLSRGMKLLREALEAE